MTNTDINRINSDMRSMDPIQAWVSNMASNIASTEGVRCWTPEEYVGQTCLVVIPNGLVGAQHIERRVDVTVTAEMVADAIKLASVIN